MGPAHPQPAAPRAFVAADPGRDLFAANCATCHGDTARGDGPAAPALDPRPTDLTTPEVMARSDDKLTVQIKIGRPGTSMLGFPALTDEELTLLLRWLRAQSTAVQPAAER